MAHDPGLAADTCIFMEAITHDGGNQNPENVWWLSPDITLTGPVSGLENADAGQTNSISVRFHRKAANSGCNYPGDESITVQVWVANPSLIMAPHLRGSASRVGFIGSPLPVEGATQIQGVDWIPPAGVPATNPESAGPKCLVAICYPETSAPSSTRFFVPGDQHLAQHNLCVVKTSGKSVSFKVNTFNPAPGRLIGAGNVKLQAVMDLAPSHFVKDMVLSRLQPLSAFQQLRTSALPSGFGFDLTGLSATQIIDHSQPSVTGFPSRRIPSFEAVVRLETKVSQLTFGVNLNGAVPGEACIYHLMQLSTTGSAEGGLTLVVLKI
jgi:hypothetical protein